MQDYDILLVEPDAMLATAYSFAIENVGYTVHHSYGAQDAIEALDKAKPKLIILELQLRTHNGIELLYELQSHLDLNDIPLLLLTFVPYSLIENWDKQFNLVGYLYKPHTSIDKLIITVEQLSLP